MNALAENASAVLLLNATKGQVLFEKNADKRLPFASITKIITSMLAFEKAGAQDPDQVWIEMEQRSYDDVRNLQPALSVVFEHIGESFTLTDYQYAALMESGCEAAQQLAYYAGDDSMECFLRKADAYLTRLGCTDTHLIDPTGLFDEGHYSTARNIARIFSDAMQYPPFRRIVSSSCYQSPRFPRQLDSTNSLLLAETGSFFAYAVGGKTGATDLAGRCLTCMFERNGQEYILVVLGAPIVFSVENKRWFFRSLIIPFMCAAFEQEGDFMRILMPEHIRKADVGDRFSVFPTVPYQSCTAAPEFHFSSANERVASVDPDGIVTIHGQGFTQVRVETQTGDYDVCFVDSRPPDTDPRMLNRPPTHEDIQNAKDSLSDCWMHVLLMGCDSQVLHEYERSDSMLIASINRKNSAVRLTSIMRDLWVDLPEHGEGKINAAVWYGGPEMAMQVVSRYTGLDIRKYAMVNMESMVGVIDSFGGVDIDITEEERIFINHCAVDVARIIKADRNIPIIEAAGHVHVNGKQAVAHMRNRKNGADYMRTARQQQVLKALAHKVRRRMNPLRAIRLLAEVLRIVRTNLNLADILRLIPFAFHIDPESISTFRIPAEGTYLEIRENTWHFSTDYGANHRLLMEFLKQP